MTRILFFSFVYLSFALTTAAAQPVGFSPAEQPKVTEYSFPTPGAYSPDTKLPEALYHLRSAQDALLEASKTNRASRNLDFDELIESLQKVIVKVKIESTRAP